MTTASEYDAMMAPLFEEAERTGKWFWCNYQSLWFSPRQLREEHARKAFRWGPVNWELRDPQEHLAEAKRRVEQAQAEVDRIALEIKLG
jgi:hypothetical protein